MENEPQPSVSGDESDEGNKIVTMVDVLQQENEQEADAIAVLGGADDQNCTYVQGYLLRQPLYSCRTCFNGSYGGICLACSFKCHEGHDLIELYTKRNFRCDCGNAAFGANKCALDPIKDAENTENEYNQNFVGKYCVCSRPYPDPDNDVEDVMLQCVVCEDWYHGRHIPSNSSGHQEGEELICHICMERLAFLRCYVTPVARSSASSSDAVPEEPVDVVTATPAVAENSGTLKDIKAGEYCKLKPVTGTGAAFMPEGWRAELCRCSTCVKFYKTHEVTFLMNEDDTVRSYENRNLNVAGAETRYERGMRALSSLDRVKRMEAIQSYNELKVDLMEYLTTFQQNNRVVGEGDIQEFFERMKAKRRRLQIQNNCR